MRPETLGSPLSCILVLTLVVSGSPLLSKSYPEGQAAAVPVAGVPIPQGYESYSLFLICNEDWATRGNDPNLLRLYDEFRTFGENIESRHAAVWFWKEEIDHAQLADLASSNELFSFVDMPRNNRFCDRYNLDRGLTPSILFTTNYPGPGHTEDIDDPEIFRNLSPEDLYVIELPSPEPDEIGDFLRRIRTAYLDRRAVELRRTVLDRLGDIFSGVATAEQVAESIRTLLEKVRLENP